MTITFAVEIDWAHDGTWTDETSRTRRVQIKSGFDLPGRAVAAIGRCVLTMDNGDQRFSPGYVSSPLYGDLLPRRHVRVSASDGVTAWVLFRGFVDEIAPDAGEWGRGECVITCVDGIALLDQQRIGVAHEDSKAVDEAVSAVVANAYTPPATSYADNGDALTHYGRSWQPEQTSCLDALREIAEAVYGRFFVARDGTPTYLSRDDRQDSSVSASVTLGDVAYWQRVRAVQPYRLVAYWRLNESSGSYAGDSSGNGYDGTASGVAWGQDGIGDGDTAAGFDGVNDYVAVYSEGLAGEFDGDEGTLMIWARRRLSTSTGHTVRIGTTGGMSYLAIYYDLANGRFRFRREASGSKIQNYYTATTEWVCLAMTYSRSADELKAYVNGVQAGATVTGLGAWVGELLLTQCALGSFYAVAPAQVWDGSLAHAALWNVALTPGEIAQIAGV
jgi:hypothetical protein